MRIEKVTFKNLNSLAGTWSIDFTNERYRECHMSRALRTDTETSHHL